MNMQLCPDAVPEFLGVFDISIAPLLLYYVYIPILFVCIFLGVFVLKSDHYSAVSKYFFLINISFATYIVFAIVQWVAAYVEIVHLAWQLYLLSEVCVFIFSVLFLYAFLYKVTTFPKAIAFATIIAVAFFAVVTPTQFNVYAFDIDNCEGVIGSIGLWAYVFELGCIGLIILMSLLRLKSTSKRAEKIQTSILATGMILFLSIFWMSNYFGEMTLTYEINLVGPIGMIIFISIISYMIVQFKVFNAKLFASQILVLAILFFIASLLFVQKLSTIHVVVIFTLGLVSVLGANLIASVKHEIEQREKIEQLAIDLKKANSQLKELDRQKDELLSIVSHQMATPVSSMKWYIEMMLDGDVGDLKKEQKQYLETVQTVAADLSDLVSMILDVSRIQLGRMKVDRTNLDIGDFFKEILAIIEPKAKEKGVIFEKHLPEIFPKVSLDKRLMRMTLENLLTNAVKYTPKNGQIVLTVWTCDDMLRYEVKDTGCGIPKTEQDRVFGKLFRASNVQETEGNGFGLFAAKGAVEAQGGSINFQSTEGKGTTFLVEVPLTDQAEEKAKKSS